MPSNIEVLDFLREKILAVYTSENMVCLSDNHFDFKGVNIMAVPDAGFEHPLWNSYKNLRDIINCNQDLMYFTGNLFLYRPLINNPLDDVDATTFDFPVSHYHQNIYDHRYCSYVSAAFEKAYNFWDRIGDLLHSFYPNLIPNIKSVDFVRMVDKVYELGERDEDFLWIRDFKDTDYADLNKFRRDVVHYYQYETTYHFNHAVNAVNFDELAILWNEKRGFPEYFKRHLGLSCEGCIKLYAYLTKVLALRNENPGSLLPVKPHTE